MRRACALLAAGALVLGGAATLPAFADPCDQGSSQRCDDDGQRGEPPACERSNGQAPNRNPHCTGSGANSGPTGSGQDDDGRQKRSDLDHRKGDYVGPERRDHDAAWRLRDDDRDGVVNGRDNCWAMPNADQQDTDRAGAGDACDIDDDNDSFLDGHDNCPTTHNPDQRDLDRDGVGDACDDDRDNDGFDNDVDNCPSNFNPDQADLDGDGRGTVCDGSEDRDGDGHADHLDNCPTVYNPGQVDADGDGHGRACDPDGEDIVPSVMQQDGTELYGQLLAGLPV